MSIYTFLRGLFGEKVSKQDIPAVEQVKQIVEPLVRRYWLNKINAASAYVESLLLDYHDNLGQEAVDVLLEGGEERLRLELDSLLATLEERLGCPLPEEVSRAVEQGSEDLLISGGLALGYAVTPRSPRPVMTARRALYLGLVARTTPERWTEVRQVLGQVLTDRALRDALRARQRTPEQEIRVSQWRMALKAPLGSQWRSWGTATVDVWAYRWHNIGRFLAGEQNGVRRWVAMNPRDERTTPFCFWVHGKVVSAARIRTQLQDYFSEVDAGNTGLLRSLWDLNAPAKNLRGAFRGFLTDTGLPPYHFNCRTVVVPVSVS